MYQILSRFLALFRRTSGGHCEVFNVIENAAVGERETLLKVNGVHVSDLEQGRGTSRTAFI